MREAAKLVARSKATGTDPFSHSARSLCSGPSICSVRIALFNLRVRLWLPLRHRSGVQSGDTTADVFHGHRTDENEREPDCASALAATRESQSQSESRSSHCVTVRSPQQTRSRSRSLNEQRNCLLKYDENNNSLILIGNDDENNNNSPPSSTSCSRAPVPAKEWAPDGTKVSAGRASVSVSVSE